MSFLLWSVERMDYINRFSNVEPAFHTWAKFHSVAVYDSFYTLWDWVRSYYVEGFCIFVQ